MTTTIKRLPSAPEILDKTAEVCGLTVSEILNQDRHGDAMYARQVATASMRLIRGMTFKQIARRFNRSSHSSVMDWMNRCKRSDHCRWAMRVMRDWAAEFGLDVDTDEWREVCENEGGR